MERFGEEFRAYVEQLLPEGGRVLEAGCGAGWQSWRWPVPAVFSWPAGVSRLAMRRGATRFRGSRDQRRIFARRRARGRRTRIRSGVQRWRRGTLSRGAPGEPAPRHGEPEQQLRAGAGPSPSLLLEFDIANLPRGGPLPTGRGIYLVALRELFQAAGLQYAGDQSRRGGIGRKRRSGLCRELPMRFARR